MLRGQAGGDTSQPAHFLHGCAGITMSLSVAWALMGVCFYVVINVPPSAAESAFFGPGLFLYGSEWFIAPAAIGILVALLLRQTARWAARSVEWKWAEKSTQE